MTEGSTDRIAAIKAATGNHLTDGEIEEAVAMIDRRRRQLMAEGKIDDLDRRMEEIATEQGNMLRLAAALQKRNAVLAILARDRVRHRVATLRDLGLSPADAVLALFEGTTAGNPQDQHSINATRLAFEDRYIGDMMAEVLGDVPEALKLIRDRAFAADIVREMFELKQGGTPGRSGNPDARKIARIFARHAEISRTEANRLGSMIGKLDGWGGPHAHDADKMLRVAADDWARAIEARLDLDRMFPDLGLDEVLDALRSAYASMTTGMSLKPAGQGMSQGPRNLIRTLSQDPVLHFRSADDWLDYQGEFGHGNIWTGMLHHQRKMASLAAQMQILGPDPDSVMVSLLDEFEVEGEERAQRREVVQDASGITVTVNPSGLTAAWLFSGHRATQSAVKLGGAVSESFSDLVTQAARLKHQGRSLFAVYADQTIIMIKTIARRTGSDQRTVADLIGAGMDGLLDDIHASAIAEDSLPGAMSSAMARFFRWSGVTGWTDSIRAAGARMMAVHMGMMADKAWSDLPEPFRAVLGRYDLTERHWALIQAAAFDGPSGNRTVTPDRIHDLSDEVFVPFIDGAPTADAIARVRLDIALVLRRFYADEITRSGTQAGTPVGEGLRLLFAFKGWPVPAAQRDSSAAPLHIGHLIATAMVAGTIARAAKNDRKSDDRQAFAEPDRSMNLEAIREAFTQSGAAGVYGDFLFGQVKRFSGGFTETVETPDITPDSLDKAYAQAREGKVQAAGRLNFVLQNTPYANLAYIRPATDYLILNALREAVAPGFLERQRVKQSAI